MNKPLKKLVYKLLIYSIILLAGLALDVVNTTSTYGLVIPSMLTVFTVISIYQYVKTVRKANDKSNIEFK